MTLFKPKVVFLCMKRLYLTHATTLTVTIKAALFALALLFVIDDFVGCSHLLVVNSKLDTIDRISETKHNMDANFLIYKNALVNDMVNNTPTIVSFGILFTAGDNSEGRIQVIDTLTSAFLPLVLMFLVLWQFVRALFRKTADQTERLLNLALIVILLFLFVWLMANISSKMSTLAEFPIINYSIYFIVNILLYILLWFILLKDYSQESNT